MKRTILIISCCMLISTSFAAGPPSILNVSYNDAKRSVEVRWENREPGVRTYILQRSADNQDWSDINSQTPGVEAINHFQYEDKTPAAVNSYYRLKALMMNGSHEYSGSIAVTTGEKGYKWTMYPVPVTDVLTLRYNGTALIKGVINIIVQRVDGSVLYRLRYASSTKKITIPVNNFGKGLYEVRLIVENEVIWSQRFVK